MTRIPERVAGTLRFAVMAGLAAALLVGCAETRPSTFYTLSSIPETAPNEALEDLQDLAVGVGPITLPQYLSRPQIVQRASMHRLELSEFDRWAEPLQDLFARVLSENLAALLNTQRIYQVPRRRATPIDYQVEVDVLRYDADADSNILLKARWALFGDDGRDLIEDRITTVAVPLQEAGNYEALVAAMSTAVADLSRTIATEIASKVNDAPLNAPRRKPATS